MPQPTRFGKLDEDVMRRTDLRGSDKVVFAALRMFENPKTGKCNPSLLILSNATGMSRSTVSGAISRLIKAGIVRPKSEENNSKNYTLSVQHSEPQVFTPLNTSVQHSESSVQHSERSVQHSESPHNNDRKDHEKTNEKTIIRETPSASIPDDADDDPDGWGDLPATYRTAMTTAWDDVDPRCQEYPLGFFARLYRQHGEAAPLAAVQEFVVTIGTVYALNNPEAYESYIGKMVITHAQKQQDQQAQADEAVQRSDLPSYQTRIQQIKQARAAAQRMP